MPTTANPPAPDPPGSPPVEASVDLRGYRTDPVRRGYQILWNYENTYWRALVGNDAWSLYEVLRSFCHDGNDTCRPSIRLLLTILGIKDRNVLIGRSKPKRVKGKEYRYPGLIEILQTHKLVVAEVTGEGPTLRYTFHVDLTPGLLTEMQLAQLPALLRKKHAALIERCEEEKRQMEAKKRPPKMAVEAETEAEGGIGISNTPIGNSNTRYWNFQHEQYPYNNTQRTTPARDDQDHNNNSSDADDPNKDVVVALTNLGLGKQVAQRLAKRYRRERIFEKIDFLQYLQETDPEKVKNPCGWLRKAIEDNYASPDGYKSPAERQAEADARRRQEETRHRQIEVEMQRREERRAQQQQAERAALDRLRAQYGTTEADLAIWGQVLAALKHQTSGPTFALLERVQPLTTEEQRVQVGVHNEFDRGLLQSHPGTHKLVTETLARIVGHPVDLEVILLVPEASD